MHQLSSTKKDRYISLTPDQTKLFCLYLPQQFYFFHFPSASEPYIKQSSSYPKASVLSCQASAHCDYTQPYNNSTSWETKQHMKYVNGCFSFCLYSIIKASFLKNRTKFDLEDKLLPVSNMASSGLKKMLDLIILYTHKSV